MKEFKKLGYLFYWTAVYTDDDTVLYVPDMFSGTKLYLYKATDILMRI